jgi:enoyl-CoA hydratase/carnithine racemase
MHAFTALAHVDICFWNSGRRVVHRVRDCTLWFVCAVCAVCTGRIVKIALVERAVVRVRFSHVRRVLR